MKNPGRKIILSFLLIVSLLSTLSFNTFALNDTNANQYSQKNYDKMVKENHSNMEYSLLMNAYKHESLSKSKSLLSDETSISYPNYYAGAYINDIGDLVVLTTTVDNSVEEIKNITRNQDIKIEVADNSYNELLDIKETIEEEYKEYYNTYSNSVDIADSELIATLVNFTGVGISERNNKVFVDLRDTSNDNIALFEKYFSSSNSIYYVQSSPAVEESTSLYCGAAIYTVNGSGSIGYRCMLKKGSQYLHGFITAGHVTGSAEFTNVYTSSSLTQSSKIGTLQAYKYSDNVDMAFIKVDSEYELLPETHNDKVVGDNYFTSISEGKKIFMSGSQSIETTGEIESNSYSFTSESGVLLTDCIKSNYSSSAGDSGGIVYAEINNSTAIVGIHHGVKTELLFFKKALIIKACNIYATYDFYTY